MRFFKLIDTTWLPGETIQNFKSLVWTERYRDSGDFTLTVENELGILSKLPLGTLVSHTDTLEVMVVENYEIDRDKERNLTITFTGRSFETFAENRVTAGSETSLYDAATGQTANVETLAAAASSAQAVTLMKGRMEPGTASAANAVPNLFIRALMRVTDTPMTQVIKRGDLYSRVMELLGMCDGGLQSLRPSGARSTLDIVVHDGIDKTATVTFYAMYEDLDDAKYFWSSKGVVNYAAIATKITARTYRTRKLAADVSGLQRKVKYVEASDLEGTYSPASPTDVVAARAQAELDEYTGCAMVEATISETARPKFKINYDVGDLVNVFGEFSVSQVMRVTEHILTVDDDGMRGYPSLMAL